MVQIIKDDITKLNVDCIVNAANNHLLGGGGVDGAIHEAAGPELLKECKTLNGCNTGDAKITKGYNLPAKYIIHTVGPVFSYFNYEYCCDRLQECYENSLNLALQNNIHSIVFPSISTGIYGFPVNISSKIALRTINDWQKKHSDYDIKVIICCYNDVTLNCYMEANKNVIK